jgi:hypothetical protein
MHSINWNQMIKIIDGGAAEEFINMIQDESHVINEQAISTFSFGKSEVFICGTYMIIIYSQQ